ncbi:hypothetical protein C8F01DRAFT_1026258 [Mycena amicta]|nr:hypothetical protein C8F01DRAFT_1026258 [Mycena amicta]
MQSNTTAPPATQESLTRVEGLWFPDCNLVIQAESSVFRMSSFFLGQHSVVFADMGSLPPPPDAETYDGCPLVRLPDSASDIRCLLKALLQYDFFEPPPSSTTLAIVSSVLRMSHKYQVTALEQRAMRHLSHIFPTTLGKWKALSEDHSLLLQISNQHSVVIGLARQFSIDWILPALFYHMCRYGEPAQILASDLSVADKIRWAVGYRELLGVENGKILDFLWRQDDVPHCSDPRRCMHATVDARQTAERWRTHNHAKQFLLPLDLWDDDDWGSCNEQPCAACLAQLKRQHSHLQKDFWARLPSIFDLPGWDVLRAMETEALRPRS